MHSMYHAIILSYILMKTASLDILHYLTHIDQCFGPFAVEHTKVMCRGTDTVLGCNWLCWPLALWASKPSLFL